MQGKVPASRLLPICTKNVNMLEGLMEEEVEQYFADHAKIIPLYEINVAEVVGLYQTEFS